MKYSNRNLTENAQSLRRNMTKEERRLWYDFLKQSGYSIKRQHVIGKFIVDFYCPEAKTVIELDGSQHFEKEGLTSDMIRDEYLKTLGIKVLRYSNTDVNCRFPAVCEDILQHFGDCVPKASP